MLDDHIEAMARYKRGIAAFESAVALKPDYAEAYCYMGDCYRFYLDCKRDPPYDEGPDYYNAHREGGAAYKKAIALKPDYIRAYYGMAHFCGSLERITIYKKIVAIKPDEATAYLFMGFAYTELGRHADAITVYKKAIEQDDATAYFYMGKAYENIEQYPEAIVAYKKYIALGPTAYFSGVASERIEELSTTQPAD
jgi:tetratricopeptide (TPR) repeat protein